MLLQIQFVQLCIILGLSSIIFTLVDATGDNKSCGVDGDCLSSPVDCNEKCGCDRAYYYNKTSEECVLDVKYLMRTIMTTYDSTDHDSATENGMTKNIQIEAEKVFKGIIVSAIIFISFASICVLTACLYCIRISYTDRKLKNDVKALAKKLHRDKKTKKSIMKTPQTPESQSCNVIVESAGVFVV
ncbi:uncharacterized protein LOC113515856 isoform X2 [Galleria mellonella]|uniref:Uncharacterized protein LOC113515856 isoform X2 n=1 Tax=Galleria mellonella TaxID=7137 RepID=A0ABM3ME13_GALME|nr:uncharacterized protein LOC113515856 isoform X2 [Galleria mellonella]